MYDNIMLDLETMGTAPGCAILSIGAVAFDIDHNPEIHPHYFHEYINRTDVAEHGLVDDSATAAWWQDQIRAAQGDHTEFAPIMAAKSKNKLFDVLFDFNTWIAHRTTGWKNVRIWSNGADFDSPILAAAFRALGGTPPWSYYNARCYRTLKALRPSLAQSKPTQKHNALADALAQAEHAVAILKFLRGAVQ